jgi:ribosomal protein S2
VSKETASARISSIALVDTNVKTFLYNIPIACNDDSLESIGFMNNIISQYVLRSKYKKVLI